MCMVGYQGGVECVHCLGKQVSLSMSFRTGLRSGCIYVDDFSTVSQPSHKPHTPEQSLEINSSGTPETKASTAPCKKKHQ